MENQNLKFLAALLGGAAVGASLAVLFAPAKGTALRSRIIDEVGDLTNNLDKKVNEFSNIIKRANVIYHDLKSK